MRGSIILFLIVVLVLSYGIGDRSTEKSVDDDSGDQDDDECEDDDDESESCENDFVGTNLFGDDCDMKKCFSSPDVALLMARKDFENLLPKDLPKCLLDDHLVEVLMKYFYSANQVIVRMSKGSSKRIVQLAFYDTLGGYLQYYLIPVAKYSFYAGILKLKTVVNIMQLFNQCKLFINTNGNGWIEAISDFSEFNLDIEPIKILKNRDEKACQSACANLILAEDDSEDDDMIVPLPKLETEEYGLLSNIWLPFKRKHHFNLRSHSSAFVLLRYYVLVTRCYQFQGVCQDTFNHKFREWYQECIEVHLNDDILYPGLGAVLRIMETLRHRKKFAFMPHQQPERGSSFSRTCPFPKTHSMEYMKLKSKVDKLSDPTKPNSLKTPLNRDSSVIGDVVMFDDDDSSTIKARRKKYITIAVLVSLFLLVFILAVAVLTKYMSSKGIKCRKKKEKDHKYSDSDASAESGAKKKKDKKHEKEEQKKHEKEMKKHKKEEKKHEKEEKKMHEKEEKKKHEEEKKKHEEEKKKHEEEKKHEKEEKKKHEKEEKKHEKEEKKHEKEASKKRTSNLKSDSPGGSGRKEGGSESSTSSSSSPQRSSRTSRRSPREFLKGGLKLNLIDEKGRSKKFSISKKNKPPTVQLPTASPGIRKRSNSMDSGGGMQLHKGALSTSWETIE